MNLSRNQFSNRLKAFNILTHGFVYDEKDEETREYLKRVMITAHNLVTEVIKDEDIEFDIYDIVTLMTAKDRPYMRDFLSRINPEDISHEDYKSFNDALASSIAENSDEQ